MPFRSRHFVCIAMGIALPASVFSQDAAGGMLQSNGVGVLVNHNPAPASAALFPKDFVDTEKGAVARIEITGSTADMNPETMVEFNPDELVLNHGSLSVNTSHGLRVRVGCLTITPVNPADWTRYEVIDTDGRVMVKANQNDLYIDALSKNPQQIKRPQQSSRDIIRQGTQSSRDEKCGATYQNQPRLPGIGAALNSPWAIGTGMAAIGTIVCLGLLCHNDDPVSPAWP